MSSGPGTGPAGRALLAHLDRIITGHVVAVAVVPNARGNFQLRGRGRAYAWRTIAHLEDAGLITATEDGDGYVLAFTAAGRKLLGA